MRKMPYTGRERRPAGAVPGDDGALDAGSDPAGGGYSMKPKPPCGRNCPKRSAIPNCHDSVVCPDWAAYQEALAEWSEAMKAEKREKADLKATKNRMAKICESRGRDKR